MTKLRLTETQMETLLWLHEQAQGRETFMVEGRPAHLTPQVWCGRMAGLVSANAITSRVEYYGRRIERTITFRHRLADCYSVTQSELVAARKREQRATLSSDESGISGADLDACDKMLGLLRQFHSDQIPKVSAGETRA